MKNLVKEALRFFGVEVAGGEKNLDTSRVTVRFYPGGTLQRVDAIQTHNPETTQAVREE